MEMIKRYAGILMMLTLLVGFTSCEDDEDIYDDLMGRTWVGDLWFGSDNNPIGSGIRILIMVMILLYVRLEVFVLEVVICKVICILMENILIILSCRCNRINYNLNRKGVISIDITPFLF